MKRKARIKCLGYDKIQVTTFCQNKEISLPLRSKYLDLVTLKQTTERSDFFLEIWKGTGSISDPYTLAVWRKNYDTGGNECVKPLLCIKRDDSREREASYDATIWDGGTKP